MHDSFNGNNQKKAGLGDWEHSFINGMDSSSLINQAIREEIKKGSGKQSSSGSGSYNRGSGGGYSSSGAASSAVIPSTGGQVQTNPYADWLAQQQAMVEAAAAAKRKAAQDAYDRSMGALNGAYNSARDALQKNYDSSIGTMTESYNNGVAGVNRQADKTQNEAYINYMLSKRDLPQMMAAQGLTGGAAESTMASLQNNYGNSRNAIDVERNGNLTDLLQELNANKASALQAYNSGLMDLENRKMAYQMQLEQALQQGIVSAANTRYDALADIGNTYLQQASKWADNVQDAAAAAAAATYTANNTPASVNAQQGASGAGSTNYSLVNRLFGAGKST